MSNLNILEDTDLLYIPIGYKCYGPNNKVCKFLSNEHNKCECHKYSNMEGPLRIFSFWKKCDKRVNDDDAYYKSKGYWDYE